MARVSRPSFLKRQKEHKRLEKAARKREERQARKAQRGDGIAPLTEGASPETPESTEESTEESA